MLVTGAPLEISEDLITTFNISLVARGTISETSVDRKAESSTEQRYSAPKANNMFRRVKRHLLHITFISPSLLQRTCMPLAILQARMALHRQKQTQCALR